jgi:hypothetical protein
VNPQERPNDPVSESCAEHARQLAAELRAALDAAATERQRAHRAACPCCAEAFVTGAVATHRCPDLPSDFADRVLARFAVERPADEAPAPTDRALAAAVAAWLAPDPPPGFAARVLAAWRADRVAAPRRRPALLRRVAGPIAALAAAALFVIVRPEPGVEPPRATVAAGPAISTSVALERLANERERLMRAVRHEMLPASIGAFDGTPRLRSRTPVRTQGTLWHASLRRVATASEATRVR